MDGGFLDLTGKVKNTDNSCLSYFQQSRLAPRKEGGVECNLVLIQCCIISLHAASSACMHQSLFAPAAAPERLAPLAKHLYMIVFIHFLHLFIF